MFRLLRLDTEAIWNNEIVKQRFHRYHAIIKQEKVAKYLVAKKTPIEANDLRSMGLDQLWALHQSTRKEFDNLLRDLDTGEVGINTIDTPPVSFLDLKTYIARELLKKCNLCERNCGIDRTAGKLGYCRLDDRSVVTSSFLHIGEEPPLIPSGTIFFASCVFKCVFCQNWTISQRWGTINNLNEGYFVSSSELARIMERLASEGSKNINYVGGDPIPNIHNILESMTHFHNNITQLWNSDMYMTVEGMELLQDVIDFWLPDLKFRDNDFAKKMTRAKNYWEVVTRNIKWAYENSSTEMIVRHLVMPGRIETDTFPILDWCAENIPRAFVNIMGQYRPEHKVHTDPRYLSIRRRITGQEMESSRAYADQLGIHWKEVS
ncbi:MAG: radical SAM protein [Candidatus Heimdallarchaeota archaeon]